VDSIAALLAEDATFAMPLFLTWWRGRDTIAAFAAELVHRYLPTRANGQLFPGFDFPESLDDRTPQ
jgi:hypothetical protein